MPLEDWKKHNILAVQNWHKGNHRKAATEYWLSFRAIPSLTHDLRYHILHGYTTTIRGDLIEATDDDIQNMELVFRDKNEPRLYRLEAGYTLGVISYSRSERMKCQEYYHHAITIGEKEPKNAKQVKLEKKKVTFPTPEGGPMEKTMKELMEGVLKDCQSNLNNLNRNTMTRGRFSMRSWNDVLAGGDVGNNANPDDPPAKKSHCMPVGRGGTTLTEEEFNNLIDVGGLHCDHCKCKSKKLFVCQRCKKAFYCSAECQKKQWKKEDGHKLHCRKDGEFQAGDLVQIARLKNKTELNDNIVRVVGPDKKNEGRYTVMVEGAVRGDKKISVAAGNLNQLRPYDCRK